MVEVFKTDVQEPYVAQRIIDQLHLKFTNYKANFDLEDCDKILRIECSNAEIKLSLILHFLEGSGVSATVLE